MSLFSAILLGLVQGVTEFLPISSSGHLAIAQELLSFTGASDIPGFFDVLLHLGTLFAVFAAYWSDIREMVVEFFCGVRDLKNHSTPTPLPPARRMILLIVVATLPLFVIVPFKDTIEALAGSLYFVAFALLATGCMLFFSDRVKKGRKTEKTATVTDALIVGLGQAIATIVNFFDPEVIVLGGGVSKAGKFLLDAVREEAPKYCIYKSMPISRIELAELGPDAGIIGAAMLGL